MDNERTNVYRFSSASSAGEVAVVSNITEVSSPVPVVGVVADILKGEEIRVRESPVVGNVADALARGVQKKSVVGNMTDGLVRIGGAGDQRENSYQEIPTGRSTSVCIEVSRTQGQQENSYQETLENGNFLATTTATEVLVCVGGLKDHAALERSTSAHEKDRAGDHQENSYQEIASGKNRANNPQPMVQGVIALQEHITNSN